MNAISRIALLAGTCVAAVACGHGHVARDQAAYRDATRQVVTAKNDQVKSCYDLALRQQAGLSGRVVVRFKVQAETGRVVEPMVDKSQTTAPDSLSQCVVRAIADTALTPPDAREAHASFSWEFRPGA